MQKKKVRDWEKDIYIKIKRKGKESEKEKWMNKKKTMNRKTFRQRRKRYRHMMIREKEKIQHDSKDCEKKKENKLMKEEAERKVR